MLEFKITNTRNINKKYQEKNSRRPEISHINRANGIGINTLRKAIFLKIPVWSNTGALSSLTGMI